IFTPTFSFKKFEVDIIDVKSGIKPDSIVVAFYNKATTDTTFMDPTSVFLIDNLSLTPASSIGEPELKSNYIPIYPNPAQTTVSIPLETMLSAHNVRTEVFTAAGSTVEGVKAEFSEKDNLVKIYDLHTLPLGMYFVKISDDKTAVHRTFSITR
ncbi:MAG TPA: T9SS type A sorting domain-containing protein, partial [Patescibacteria group bacterium]|nr:T9SS type A sorting domain-containing protein [Patescibacteria group bacterium]